MSKLVTKWRVAGSAYPAEDVAHITPKLISAPKAAREKWAKLDAELEAREKLVVADWNARTGIAPNLRKEAIDSDIQQLRADIQTQKVAALDAALEEMSANRLGFEHAQARYGHKARWMLDCIYGSKLSNEAAAWAKLIEAMGPTERAELAQALVAQSGENASLASLLPVAYALQAAERAKPIKERAFELDGEDGFLTALSTPGFDKIKAGIDEAARELAAFEREANDIRRTGRISAQTRMANALADGALDQREPPGEGDLPNGATAKIAAGLRARQAERA